MSWPALAVLCAYCWLAVTLIALLVPAGSEPNFALHIAWGGMSLIALVANFD